jgi:hypothetical protein
VAAVRKMFRPHTTGDDQPTPGTSATHSTLSVLDQRSGRFGLSETGSDFGPRKPGQLLEVFVGASSPAATGNSTRKETVATTPQRNGRWYFTSMNQRPPAP